MSVTDHPNGSTHCVTCRVFRPESEPRHPEHPAVCDGDRALLAHHLHDIAGMHQRLAHPGVVEADTRTYKVVDDQGHATGELRRRDPVAADLPVAAVRSRTRQPSVSGSRVAPTPISVDAADLTAAARNGSSANPANVCPDDQVGYQPTATVLDQWVRCWRDTLWPDHSLPTPRVPVLVRWLTDRLDRACDAHPAISDFAAEVRAQRYALRRALGETEPRPAEIGGASCRRCELRNVLIVRPGDVYVECAHCGLLSTEAEHLAWMCMDAAHQRSLRSAEEVAELLRVG